MKFKSDEFMRNIEIEKEKASLKQQSDALDAEKNKSIIKTKQYFDDEPVIVDIKQQQPNELKDILLEDNDESTKRKYIIFSVALIILFIITIIIIRVLSYSSNDEDKLFTQVEPIKQDKMINSEDNPNIKQLDINKIAQEEIPLPKTKEKIVKKEIVEEAKSDVFGMESFPKVQPKQEIIHAPIVEKIIPKKKIEKTPVIPKAKVIVKKEIKSLFPTTKIQPKKITKITGNYIQVGAFTTNPNKKLIYAIKKYKYPYIIHKMIVKGTSYKKVLIGPYSSEATIRDMKQKIKKDLKIKSPYTLRLK